MEKKKIDLNLAQLIMATARQKIKFLIGGRALGKSTSIANEVKDTVYDMPRSSNAIVGATYQQILTRTLPSTIAGLDMLGLYKDKHYFIGKRAPANWRWPEAYEPVLKYDYAIQFYNGATYILLSQDVSSRGLNIQSAITDESTLINYEKYQAEIMAALRGRKANFKDNRKYLNQSFYGSLPRLRKGEWIYEWEKEAKISPDKILYLMASSYFNSDNLPDDWFEMMRRSMTALEYSIEIENKKPDKLSGAFYPYFDTGNDGHLYSSFNNDYLQGLVDNSGYNANDFKSLTCLQDSEISRFQPLDIALDCGASVNCIVTGQEDGDRYNILSAKAQLHPKLLQDVLREWCDYYRPHNNKTVNYYYDHTMTGRSGITDTTYADTVIEYLKKEGWIVNLFYMGKTSGYDVRYNFWGLALRGGHPNLPIFKFHQYNCDWLIKSMCNAVTKQSRKLFEKNKDDERKPLIDQRTTTHLSDAVDSLCYGRYGSLIGTPIGFTDPLA